MRLNDIRRMSAGKPFDPKDITGLACWLRSDLGVTLVADKISAWTDQSGNGRSVTQTVDANRPTLTLSGGAGGRPKIISGASGSTYLTFASGIWSSLAAGEIFIAARRDTTGVGSLYGIGGTVDTCFFNAGAINDAFGSTVRYSAGSYGAEINSPFIYNVSAAPGAWTNRINGTVKYTIGSNTVAWQSASKLLATSASDPGTYYFVGDFYEVIVFGRVLSAIERALVMSYLSARYAITVT